MRDYYDAVLYRGTTATNVFVLADALQDAEITACYATYWQHEKTVLEKSLADMSIERVTVKLPDGTAENKRAVVVNLTQAETLQFEANNPADRWGDARVQLRVKTARGEAAATRYVFLRVHDVIKEGVI